MQRREEARQQQLQSCADDEKQRARRLEELVRQRAEATAERSERSEAAVSKAQRSIDGITEKHLAWGRGVLARSCSPNTSVSTTIRSSEQSQVAIAVAQHRERQQELEAKREELAMEREAASFRRAEQVRAFERLQETRRFSASEVHSRQLEEHADRARELRDAASNATLAAHMDKEARSRKHFESLRGEVRESMAAAAEAQAAKILAALELTRVKQHEELMRSVEEKRKRQQEKDTRRREMHALSVARRLEEQRAQDEHKRQFIAANEQAREERLAAFLQAKTARVEAAVRSKEDHVQAAQEKLARQSQEVAAKLAADAAAQSSELARKRAALAQKDEVRSRLIADAKASHEEALIEAGALRDLKIEQVQLRASSQQEVRMAANVEKLVHVYEVGKDHVKHISFTPLRARTASPT
jgi:hypothetical protein